MSPLQRVVLDHLVVVSSATTTEVARALGIPPGSTHRVLHALRRRKRVRSRRGVRGTNRAVRQWVIATLGQFPPVDGVQWAEDEALA